MARPKKQTHVITEQDIDLNPELKGQVEVGEEVELGPQVRYIVAQRFYERGNVSKVYEVGEDVSHLDGERLEGLVSKGLVELR